MDRPARASISVPTVSGWERSRRRSAVRDRYPSARTDRWSAPGDQLGPLALVGPALRCQIIPRRQTRRRRRQGHFNSNICNAAIPARFQTQSQTHLFPIPTQRRAGATPNHVARHPAAGRFLPLLSAAEAVSGGAAVSLRQVELVAGRSPVTLTWSPHAAGVAQRTARGAWRSGRPERGLTRPVRWPAVGGEERTDSDLQPTEEEERTLGYSQQRRNGLWDTTNRGVRRRDS